MKFCKSRENKIAIAVSLFIAALHVLWAISVAFGLGQTYLDWIFPLHLLNNPFSVMSFSFLNTALLVVVAFVATYLSALLLIWFLKVMKIKK